MPGVHILVVITNTDMDCYVFEDKKDACKCARVICKQAGIPTTRSDRLDTLQAKYIARKNPNLLLYFVEEICPKGKYRKA